MKLTAISTACLLASLGAASAAAPKTPSFLARRDYAGQGGLWVNAADTNGDGVPDLILSEWKEGQILVLFGDGNGTFRTGPVSTGVWGVNNSVAVDLNGDGNMDLVSGGIPVSGGNGGIGVSFGNGDGTFQPPVDYPAGNDFPVGQVVLGDFNGDGILDAALNGSSGIWLFTGAGGGVFKPGVLVVPMTGIYNGRMTAADFNNDGSLDLALTYGYGFDLLLGNGNGTFQPAKHFMAPGGGGFIGAGVLIPGGNQDVVLLGGTAGAYVLFGNGKGGFSAPKAVSLPYATTIAIGDVNGDGIPDLVSGGVYVALGDGKGGFSKPIFYAAQVLEGPYTVLVTDLRNDGRNDIVTVDVAASSVLLNKGDGKFQDGDWTPVAGAGACGAAADYNGDGKPDLAINTSTGVTVLLGTGSAKSPFKAGTPIALPNAACLVTGDLNGDGIPDLLVPANTPNAIYAYLGNGDGTFTLKSTIQTPNSGGYIVLGDFNNDGKLDVATSDNLLALGNGDGTFQTPVPFVPNPPTDGFFYIAAGDINGDGWTDLVLDNWQEDYIYVLLNNQMGGYTQSVINPNLGAQLGPGPITLASLTPGGNVDMIYGGLVGAASIYLGDGKGGFTYSQTLDAADGLGPNDFSLPFTFVVADVNGDGIPDITLNESGTLGIFLGKGNGNFQLPTKYFGVGPEPGSLLVENLHGQSPTAGLPDIVAPDFFGGVTVIINTTK